MGSTCSDGVTNERHDFQAVFDLLSCFTALVKNQEHSSPAVWLIHAASLQDTSECGDEHVVCPLKFISRLSCSLDAFSLSPQIRREDLKNPSIGVLIGEGPDRSKIIG